MEAVVPVGFSIWGIVKVFVLIALLIYTIFAFVVVKQVNLMSRTVQINLSGLLKIVGYIHLIFAVLLFIFAFVVL
ncbi:hypothetical protein HY045_04000 [Candidatus Woesebacteria bacterium]|nr:hypothetical protein [Candidatus Woesebacteria bacterium]